MTLQSSSHEGKGDTRKPPAYNRFTDIVLLGLAAPGRAFKGEEMEAWRAQAQCQACS